MYYRRVAQLLYVRLTITNQKSPRDKLNPSFCAVLLPFWILHKIGTRACEWVPESAKDKFFQWSLLICPSSTLLCSRTRDYEREVPPPPPVFFAFLWSTRVSISRRKNPELSLSGSVCTRWWKHQSLVGGGGGGGGGYWVVNFYLVHVRTFVLFLFDSLCLRKTDNKSLFFNILFCSLECVGHSFADVDHFLF
jgi:hypothetical protein